MQDFLSAIGLVLVIEGVVYGGFPHLAKRLGAEVQSMPDGALRGGGLAAVALGVLIVWLVRGLRRIYRAAMCKAQNAPYFSEDSEPNSF